ncbi:hypothetical protein [Armatimonas sp.]|uniref:hypothetical protein n=1 Tax=Armatimonas sp. TaxID=1872638 RepID=UPI00286B9792|nr:hypothetical protein [Armatimonas sp.]
MLKIQMKVVLDHWNRLETELGQAVSLEGGYTRDQMVDDLAALEDGVTGVTVGVSEQERQAQVRDALKTKLLTRFDQAKNKLKAQFRSTRHAAAVPRKPDATLGQDKTLAALEDLVEVWKTLNTDTSLPTNQRPMTIARGYTQADFAADIAALKATYVALGTAARETKQRRATRSTPLSGLAKRVTQYRALAKSELEPTDALYATIP